MSNEFPSPHPVLSPNVIRKNRTANKSPGTCWRVSMHAEKYERGFENISK